MPKKRLIHLSPGPVFKIRKDKFSELSKEYIGDIITSSPVDSIANTVQVCGFNYNCLKVSRKYLMLANILFLLHCIRFCIKRRIQGVRYDFVTTYDPLKTGLFGVIVSKLLGIKLIVEVNGVYDSPAEYLDGAGSLSVELKRRVYPVIEKFVLQRASGIKLLFEGQINSFSSVLQGKVIRSFSNLVDIGRFSNIESEERKEVLFVGFPFRRKGVDILIESFKKLANDYPDWTLKILGWYPDSTELLGCIDDHPQIAYHPPVEYDEMPEHLGKCAILVLPSRSEAMGRILIEGMAAGKPRIGANVDGIPTVIRDGVDGLLFETENVDDLCVKLAELMSSPELRGRLGDAGKKRAITEMTKETYFQNIFELYDTVVN